MKTLADLTGATGLPVDMHLVLDTVIPVDDGLQAQGDLLIIPAEVVGQVGVHADAAWAEVPPGGVELLRGEAGGNAHTLVADPGTCVWTADLDDATGLAIVAFEALAPVYLLHREHGGTGIASGRYIVRRQREHVPMPAPRWTRFVAGTSASLPRRLFQQREMQRAARARYVAD